MLKRAFISFRGEDEFKVNTLRGLARFKNVTFTFLICVKCNWYETIGRPR
jgi:hypothetical protein